MIKEFLHIFRDSPNSFHGQKADEKVLKLLRHHPFNVILKLLFLLIAGLAPFIAGIVFWAQISENGFGDLFFFALSVWWLTLWLGAFKALTMYTLNTVIITNERLIDHAQLGFFNRKVSELDAARIQDVSAHTNGFIETFLDFGDVKVQTAAVENHFIFHTIPKPEKVKDIVMELTKPKI